MKKYATISLFVFWAVTVAVVAAGLVVTDNKNNRSPDGVNQAGNSIRGSISEANPGATELVLSSAELAKHNSGQSCWLLISGKIYDVTAFLNQHPGNASTILPTCGTDATTAYATKGPEDSPHSANAHAMLKDYYIGDLNQTLRITPSKATNTSQTKDSVKTNTPPSTSIPTPPPPTQSSAQNTILALTSTELTKHNSGQSCWLLISGKIYDVTNYIRQHPGGANEILPTCGTDATTAYATRGGTGSHSSSALAQLTNYYIGDLNQTITTNSPNQTSPTTTNPTPNLPTSGRDDDEEEDD